MAPVDRYHKGRNLDQDGIKNQIKFTLHNAVGYPEHQAFHYWQKQGANRAQSHRFQRNCNITIPVKQFTALANLFTGKNEVGVKSKLANIFKERCIFPCVSKGRRTNWSTVAREDLSCYTFKSDFRAKELSWFPIPKDYEVFGVGFNYQPNKLVNDVECINIHIKIRKRNAAVVSFHELEFVTHNGVEYGIDVHLIPGHSLTQPIDELRSTFVQYLKDLVDSTKNCVHDFGFFQANVRRRLAYVDYTDLLIPPNP